MIGGLRVKGSSAGALSGGQEGVLVEGDAIRQFYRGDAEPDVRFLADDAFRADLPAGTFLALGHRARLPGVLSRKYYP